MDLPHILQRLSNRMWLAVGVKQAAYLCQYLRQNTEQGGGDGDCQRVLRLLLLDPDPSDVFLDPHRSVIGVVSNRLHAGDSAGTEKAQHLLPAIGRTVADLDRKAVGTLCPSGSLLMQGAWRELILPLENGVETPQAAKTRGHRYVQDRKPRVRQQLLCQQQTAGLPVLEGRHMELRLKDPAQMAVRAAKPCRQLHQTLLVAAAGLDLFGCGLCQIRAGLQR